MNTQETLNFIRKFFEQPLSQDIRNRFGQWLTSDYLKDEKNKALQVLWAEESVEANHSTLEDLEIMHTRIAKSAPRRFRLNRLLRVAAAIALLVTGTLISYIYLNSMQTSRGVKMLECFVPFGERKSIKLPDGSIVWLNAGSLLIYPEEFTGNIRSLYLSGEAEFTVKKNKEKPFIVKTNHIEVEALGTVFTVTSFPGDSTTKAMLEEGSVRVGVNKNELQNRILVPNELLTYSHNSEKFTVSSIDAKQLARWKEGYLIFQTATLTEIFSDIERRHNVSISYDNQRLGKGIYNVKFMPNETVEQNFEVLQELIPGFNYRIKGNSIYIN